MGAVVLGRRSARVDAMSQNEHVLSLGHRRLAVVSFALHRSPRRGQVDERAQAAATYPVTRDRRPPEELQPRPAMRSGRAWSP